ncbi:hypothetical protein Q5692_28125 [Microcoleus sp. C2C3]
MTTRFFKGKSPSLNGLSRSGEVVLGFMVLVFCQLKNEGSSEFDRE